MACGSVGEVPASHLFPWGAGICLGEALRGVEKEEEYGRISVAQGERGALGELAAVGEAVWRRLEQCRGAREQAKRAGRQTRNFAAEEQVEREYHAGAEFRRRRFLAISADESFARVLINTQEQSTRIAAGFTQIHAKLNTTATSHTTNILYNAVAESTLRSDIRDNEADLRGRIISARTKGCPAVQPHRYGGALFQRAGTPALDRRTVGGRIEGDMTSVPSVLPMQRPFSATAPVSHSYANLPERGVYTPSPPGSVPLHDPVVKEFAPPPEEALPAKNVVPMGINEDHARRVVVSEQAEARKDISLAFRQAELRIISDERSLPVYKTEAERTGPTPRLSAAEYTAEVKVQLSRLLGEEKHVPTKPSGVKAGGRNGHKTVKTGETQAVCTLQRFARNILAKREYTRRTSQCNVLVESRVNREKVGGGAEEAVCTMQRCFRCYAARKVVQSRRKAYRAYIISTVSVTEIRVQKAMIIQRNARKMIAKISFTKKRAAYERYISTKTAAEATENDPRVAAACTIQRFARVHRAKRTSTATSNALSSLHDSRVGIENASGVVKEPSEKCEDEDEDEDDEFDDFNENDSTTQHIPEGHGLDALRLALGVCK